MGKIRGSIAVFLVLLLGAPLTARGADGGEAETVRPGLEIEAEYLAPLDKDRMIDTVSVNIMADDENFDGGRLSYSRGVTVTRAWGSINRAGCEGEHEMVGIGPNFLLRYELKQWERSRLSFDMSGGLIIYNKRFMVDGHHYNFMWRIGPKYTYQINSQYCLNIAYKVMHVSNGQTSHNPAYNSDGFSMSVTRLW
jgi:lipid A 3-O-deacylase